MAGSQLVSIVLGSAVLVKILDIAYDIYKTKTKKKVDVESMLEDVKALKAGVENNSHASKSILRDRLLYLGKKYLTEGNVPIREFESYSDMYYSYRRLGGNGFVKEIYEEVCELDKIA